MIEVLTSPVVSVIVERTSDRSRILMQRRTKPEGPGLGGLLELPQGRIRAGESLYQCAIREIEEETGLTGFRANAEIDSTLIGSESLEALTSVVCVSETGYHSYLAVCLIGNADGSPRASSESSEPRWVSREEVITALSESDIYPLNVPMLVSYYGIRIP